MNGQLSQGQVGSIELHTVLGSTHNVLRTNIAVKFGQRNTLCVLAGNLNAGRQRHDGRAAHLGHTVQVALVAVNGVFTVPAGEGSGTAVVGQLDENLTRNLNVIGNVQDEVTIIDVVGTANLIDQIAGGSRLIILIPAPNPNGPTIDVEIGLLLKGSYIINRKLPERIITDIESHAVNLGANHVLVTVRIVGKTGAYPYVLRQYNGLVVGILNIDIDLIHDDDVAVSHHVVDVNTMITVGQG